VATILELPRDFKLSNVTNLITGPAAELRIRHEYRARTVWLNYEYQALTNFVPVSLVPAHLESLARMEKALGYSLQWQNADGLNGSKTNWPVLVLAVLYSSLMCVGAVMLYRSQSWLAGGQTAPPESPGHPLAGVGGWLILVGAGLVFSTLRLVIGIIKGSQSFSPLTWRALTHPGGVSYNPLWGPLLIFELLGQLTMVVVAITALLLFVEKRRLFPRVFIGLLVFNALFVLADTVAVHLLHSGSAKPSDAVARNLATVVIGCGIWIPYMLRSRRAKATFVK